MPNDIAITVNGKSHTVQSAPNTPLLYVLRNEFGLNGPQFGCGLEQCGACTVLVGAKATPACRLPVSDVGSAAITTLEGLSQDGELHPVQRAFIEQQAAQCGFCVNGMVIAAAALLWKNPHPSDEQLRAALDGHLCRCGTHLRILRAIQRAAELLAEAEQTTPPETGDTPPPQITPEERHEQNPAASAARETFFGKRSNQVDSWLAIAPDGALTVFSGKVELGTGVRTALAQIVAEELDVPVERVRVVMGDTQRTPDEGYTAGSMTIAVSGSALRQAAAEARQALLELAGEHLDARPEELAVQAGRIVVSRDPVRAITYAELMGGKSFQREISNSAPLKRTEDYKVVGASTPRVDLPGKLTGQPSFIQDLRVPGMLHGRVVPPPNALAQLSSIDESSVASVPGVVKVVRRGNWVGVVAEREEQALLAGQRLKLEWSVPDALPHMEDLYASLRRQPPVKNDVLVEAGDTAGALARATQQFHATYCQPYHAHASMGPSCAVADVRDGQITVWCSTQGPYPLRGALAELLDVTPEAVHVIHVEGAGSYGQNGADDAAADAVLLSQAVSRPVRVQWSREHEFVWEPKAAAMVMELTGGLDADGNIIAWEYDVWTPTHAARPRFAAQLLAAQWAAAPGPAPVRFFIGGERNAPTNYEFPNQRVRIHWLANSPLRVSSFRSLGGAGNTFANESFVDEMAAAAGADALEFRLRHLADPRARAVLNAAAARAGWQARPAPRRERAGASPITGRGLAFARYENNLAYVATVAEVQVDRDSGAVRVQQIVVAHDCGLIINPDGVTNQVQGNVIQSLSRALKEEVAFEPSQVTSVDWLTYPILTFSEVPRVEVVLINRPDQPALGAGEPATVTTAPAVANAIYDACGARLRQVPFTPERVRAAWLE